MAKTKFVDFRAVKTAITMEQLLGHYNILDQFKRGTDSLNRIHVVEKRPPIGD